MTLITLNKNTFINPARPIDNPDSLADNLMTSLFSLKFNSLASFEKKILWRHGRRNVTCRLRWIFQNYFREIYLIICLWNPFSGFFCVIKKIFAFSVGGLFSLSTHALTCLRRRRFRRWRKLRETVLPSNTIMSISFEASGRGTQWPIIKKASEAPGLTKCWSLDWLKEQEENRLTGENIDRLTQNELLRITSWMR